MYIQMGKLRFTFTNIFFLVGVVASILLFENLSFFAPNDANPLMTFGMDNSYFFLTFFIALFSYAALIVYEAIYNKSKINLRVLIPIATLFLTVTIGVILFDGMHFNTVHPIPDLVIDGWNKFRHILTLFLYALSIYCAFTYFNKNNPSLKRLKYIFLAVVLFVLGITIYSVIKEYSIYEYIANKNVVEPHKFSVIKSIFMNSNMYSGMLLMGIASAIGLNYFKKNPLSYISMIGFCVIQIFVNSISGTIISLTTVAIYFAFEIFVNFKEKKKFAYLKLFAYVIPLVTITVLFCLAQGYDIPVLSHFCRFMYAALSNSDFKTITKRTVTWGECGNFMGSHPLQMIFGLGLNNTNRVIGGMVYDTHHTVIKNYSLSAHNGFVHLFMDLGIIGLLVYAFFIGYYFYMLIKLMKKHYRFALIFLLLGVAYFSYAMSESIIAFIPSAQGMLIGILFYLPVFNKYKHLKETEIVNDVIDFNKEITFLSPELVVKYVTRFFLSITLAVSSLFFVVEYVTVKEMNTALLSAFIACLLALFTVPYIAGLLAKKGNFKDFAIRMIIFSAIYSIPSLVFSLLMLIPSISLVNGFEWIIFVIMVMTSLACILLYSQKYQGSFALYSNIFKTFKMVWPSIAIIAGMYILLICVRGYIIAFSPLTVILLIVLFLVIFNATTLISKDKDLKEIVEFIRDIDLFYLKHNVIRDRLEEPYEI